MKSKDGKTIIENPIIDKYMAFISPIAWKVYSALCRFRDWDTGNCWPSNKMLCEITGLCKPSVIKAGRELEDLGLLKKWRHAKTGSRTYKTFYHLKRIEDISPIALVERQKPTALAKCPRKRDEKGRFLPFKVHGVGLSQSNGVGLNESMALDSNKTIEHNHRTNHKATTSHFSFKSKQEEEVVRELVQLKGKEFARNKLVKLGRNPALVDKIKA